MKTQYFKLTIVFFLLLSYDIPVSAEDLKKIVSLTGSWKFSIGDDSRWANPSFDDSSWDEITVPGQWESQGYNDYNGYAWYRKVFKISNVPNNNIIYLKLGRIDDVDVVYINGKEIGKSGMFPPDFKTAGDRKRKYIIPEGYLNEKTENLVAVRVYDSYGEGGMTDGPDGIYIDEDNELVNVNLSGKWKFKPGNDKNWKSAGYDDNNWNTIYVPAIWETQGYESYDGYAWYRIEFTLKGNLPDGTLYLSLGKIDDTDDVYLNGDHIGNVSDLKQGETSENSGLEYNITRLYKIPDGLLKKNGANTIAVKVYDKQGQGGIYEGPVGIMSSDNYHKYQSKHHNGKTLWNVMVDEVLGWNNQN